jgi:hypothetical protein
MKLRRDVVAPEPIAVMWLTIAVLLATLVFAPYAAGQSDVPAGPSPDSQPSAQSSSTPSDATSQPVGRGTGTISGTIAIRNGSLAAGALVRLTREGQPPVETVSGDNGEFSFTNQPAGPFSVEVTAEGFESKEFSGSLQPGKSYVAPEIVLAVTRATTEVNVSLTVEEVATEQLKYQEQQRVLGFIPNFYASYVPDAAPLSPRQKFQLSWKSVSDPISIVGAGFLAGIYQASDTYPGYGQGAEGYFKRFGATYGDVLIGTFIGSAMLPSVFHQDPRYFYRGTGTIKSRTMYALANAVMCKGDNKKYEVNYSAILGAFMTGAISYTYYPASDRSASLLVQTALIRIAEGSVAGLFQEFVVKRLTPHLKKEPPPQN